MNETTLIASAFTDPLIEGDQVYGPLASLDDIHQRNSALLFPVNWFFKAYDSLQIINSEYLALNQGQTILLKLIFTLNGKEYDAYARAPGKTKKAELGGVFISSSGQNSVTLGEFTSVTKALGGLVDPFLFVKPNEDWLAFHNGKNKLNCNCYINWLLNHGGSYSAYYIIASMAVTKYLRSVYGKVLVAGCSQGGAAALFNSLQSQPDMAIIASGYSIIFDRVVPSGHSQIIVPGLDAAYTPEFIRDRIHQSATSYFFSYGKTDNAYYAYEAEKGLTLNFMAGRNFAGVAHAGGHEFPAQEIRDFIARKI